MQIPDPKFSMMPFGGYDPQDVDAFIDRLEQATATDPPTITADEVEHSVFRKARRRGYAAAEVDQWLDLVAAGLRTAASGTSPTVRSAAPGPAVPGTVVPGPTGSTDGVSADPSSGAGPASPISAPVPTAWRPEPSLPESSSGGYPQSSSVEPPEPVVDVVHQNRGLPKGVVLAVISALVVVVVVLLYIFV